MRPARLLLAIPVLLSAIALVSLRAALDAPTETEIAPAVVITQVSFLR